ncbi:MAG: hypothetical protein J6V44_16680 [Methanobrevibacter sp.]|nr:hypothetical protein [Methanobrevibacter sp.]MBO7691960.1 hypothetical protein [Methanobrevibacter sp.]
MITIPIWLLTLLIILAAPVALFAIAISLCLITAPLFALRAAALADRHMEEKRSEKENEQR